MTAQNASYASISFLMRWPLYFSYTTLGPVMLNVTRAIIALAAKAFFDVLKDTKEKMTPEDD